MLLATSLGLTLLQTATKYYHGTNGSLHPPQNPPEWQGGVLFQVSLFTANGDLSGNCVHNWGERATVFAFGMKPQLVFFPPNISAFAKCSTGAELNPSTSMQPKPS